MLRGLGTQLCECGPNANVWIQYWFSDCVYTQWETVAFCIGLSSMLFWIVAQLPQFITNIMNQSADALSPWFLFQWLGGDTFNFLGCLFTGDQLATETLTATYFIFADAAIISQYLYYQFRNRDRLGVLDESVHKPRQGYLNVTAASDDAAKLQDLLERAALPAVPAGSVVSSKDGTHFACSRETLQNALQHPALPAQRIDVVVQDDTVIDLKKQVRRVISLYGLEYGPPKSSKLTVDQIRRLQKQQCAQEVSCQPSKAPAVKAVACLAGLFLVCTSRGGGYSTGVDFSGQRLFGRRSLLGLKREQKQGHSWQLPSLAVAFPWLQRYMSTTQATSYPSIVGRKLLMICGQSKNTLLMHQIGTGLGWGSSVLYLGSRVAQLRKNHQRQSAEGLSMGMVGCAMLANLTYGTSILMRANSWSDLTSKAPWILGSLGTVSMDVAIFLQAKHFSYRLTKKACSEPDERTPLLA